MSKKTTFDTSQGKMVVDWDLFQKQQEWQEKKEKEIEPHIASLMTRVLTAIIKKNDSI